VNAGSLEVSVSERFAELRTRDYTARAESLTQTLTHETGEEDLDSMLTLWQTVRLCPRCSLAIQRSDGCNSFYCICGHHFDFMTAPRVIGKGIINFGEILNVAKRLGVSLQEAEKYGSDISGRGKRWRMARAVACHGILSGIVAETRISMDEAWELQQQARSGNEDARARIREARGRVKAKSATEEHANEEEVACTLIWDHVSGQEQGLTDACIDGQDINSVAENTSDATYEPAAQHKVVVLETLGLSSCTTPELLRSLSWPVCLKKKGMTIMANHVAGNFSQ